MPWGRLCRAALCLALAAPGASAVAAADRATDPSFVLTATAADFEHYFPAYLANGYFSTMTSPRGTEGNRAYMVAFMDYTPGDISRPAAIPGWSEVDYNPGGGWLNRTRLDAKIFADYAQTLDMHDGTLATRYRFDYANKSTDVQVLTLVSQASPHLAATRFTITPQFDGTGAAELPDPPLVRPPAALSHRQYGRRADDRRGDRQRTEPGQQAGAHPRPRAGVVPGAHPHPGQRRRHPRAVAASAGQGGARAGMAEAATIELPAGVTARAVQACTRARTSCRWTSPCRCARAIPTPSPSTWRYRGRIGAATTAPTWRWPGPRAATALTDCCRRIAMPGIALWASDIVIDGDPAVQKAVHSDLYYLLSNTTVGTAWPMGACALTPNYAGHAFWDSDSWVFPALLLLHPERAKPIVMFRDRTLAPARERARRHGVQGTMYPWEADPQTGVDVTPHFAYEVYREVHVNADVAIAQWQYYLATGDKAWLQATWLAGDPRRGAFWASRVTYDKARDRYEIHHVTSPDEAYSRRAERLVHQRRGAQGAAHRDPGRGAWSARRPTRRGATSPARCSSRSTSGPSATATSMRRCRTTRSPGWALRWSG